MKEESILRIVESQFRDLKKDPENKKLVDEIRNNVKSIIYKNNEFVFNEYLKLLFNNFGMNIGIYNNTQNITDQYIVYVSYGNEIGISVLEVSKKDLIN